MVVPIDCGFMPSARARSAVVAGPSLGQARQDGGLGQGKLMRGGRRAHAAHQQTNGLPKVDYGNVQNSLRHGNTINE